ncbi:FAD-binding oxidoreductase [Ferruginibacter lapsinanis]|uniref:FAD-binding oxidoreductase n=1 Tax=Ferruginibacter lapsinanis TaxID=563172 RepID=UPI001E468C48|nr:FAD-binding oxidoreductase [Ferruginibacter lapsinanis]UEG50826.1 FAD-binding oxidoreductase [Ferruginibacter lapsinanis]
MSKKYHRKDFLKLALLTNAAIYAKPIQSFAENFLPKDILLSDKNVDYFKKGDPQYEILRSGFNKRIDKYPAIIALCKNTQGVVEAMAYAVKANLAVTVKSGGHCMEGFSCNNGGMVINLSLLSTVEWVNNETIKVGPGCTLSKLYDSILPKGKIIPGGSCGGVGIGGLTLGGGYGLLSRQFGLACDSLVGVTMVDGKGVVRYSSNDKELLWACRGGGNGNFGVITEMTFRVHKAPATLQSMRFKAFNVNAERANKILETWFTLSAKLPKSCFSAYVLNGKTVYILLTNTEKYSGDALNFIQSITTITDKVTRNLPQPIAKALKVFYGQKGPVAFKNASAGLYKDFTEIKNFIPKVLAKVIATPRMIYQVNTLGGNIQLPELATTAAFPHRASTYFSELQTYWEDPKKAAQLMESFETVQKIFQDNGITTQYRNYPDINFKHWDKLYYGDNYRRLQTIKNIYDPQNIIRSEQSIQPA